MYITREKLIDDILNEDAVLDTPTSPKKRSKFLTNTNIDKETYSRGGQNKLDFNKMHLIFRAPTAKEIFATGDKYDENLGGDRQIVQIRALTKVLFDFNLLDKVYKSKKADFNEGRSNAAAVDKSSKNIERVFSKNYSPDTPVEEVAEDLENSTTSLEKEYKIRFPEVIGAFENWARLLTIDPGSKNDEFPEGFNPHLMANVEAVSGNDYKEIYKKVRDFLIDKSLEYRNPKELVKYIEKNETMRAILNEPVIKGGFHEAMTSPNVKDVEDLTLFLQNYLTKRRIEPEMGHTMTHIHNVAMKRIKYFDLIMKRKGFENGMRNWGEMIDFLEEYDKNTYEHILRTYDLTDESIREFTSYKNFCDWLWGNPDNLYKVLQSVPTRVGSRAPEQLVKGMDMADRRRNMLKRENTKLKQIDQLYKPSGKRGPRGSSIEELTDKIAELENMEADLTDKLQKIAAEEGLITAADRKDSVEYQKVYKLKFDAGKRRAALKHTIKKLQAKLDSGEMTERPKSLEDRYAEMRDDREALEDRAFNRLKDARDMEEFNQIYNRQRRREQSGDYDMGSGYRTMAFSLKLSSTEHEVLGFILDITESYLNKKELAAGKEDLINVDYEPGHYDGGMRTYPCTRIIIDYPERSNLFSRLKRVKDKSERGQIVGEIIQYVLDATYDKFKKNVGIVTGDPAHKIKIMAKNEATFSYRD